MRANRAFSRGAARRRGAGTEIDCPISAQRLYGSGRWRRRNSICCIIVDDDEDILIAARLALRGLFREIVTVSSPDRAIAAAAGRSPDVILLDANFARGATDAHEGLALLDQLLAADPEAIIVMITAHAGVNVAVEAMKHGATDFVSKPWENERLVQTVRTAAALRRSRRAAPRAGPDLAADRRAADRQRPRDGARPFADRARRADRRQRAGAGRERHRQGTRRARAARSVAARAPSRWSRSISARSPPS